MLSAWEITIFVLTLISTILLGLMLLLHIKLRYLLKHPGELIFIESCTIFMRNIVVLIQLFFINDENSEQFRIFFLAKLFFLTF